MWKGQEGVYFSTPSSEMGSQPLCMKNGLTITVNVYNVWNPSLTLCMNSGTAPIKGSLYCTLIFIAGLSKYSGEYRSYTSTTTWTSTSREAGVENVILEWLLYNQEGAKKAEELWKAFERKRRGLEEVGDEDEEAAEKDLEWGRGDMGRDANNEGNLAERGYGK